MQLEEFSITGRRAIVTGASRGIGKGIARTLAEAGAEVCIVARGREALEAVAEEIRGKGGTCVVAPADVTKAVEVDAAVSKALTELGGIYILVNNAGIAVVKPMVPLPGFSPKTADSFDGFFEQYSGEEWDRVLDTNLKSAFLFMRAVGPHMIERQAGKIIQISSVNSVKAGKYRFTYDVSKAGLAQLTRSMAVEWARYHINVNAIGAGYVDTELTEVNFQDERLKSRILSEIPFRRLATVREVALLTVFLASAASDYLTGQTVFLDGGALA